MEPENPQPPACPCPVTDGYTPRPSPPKHFATELHILSITTNALGKIVNNTFGKAVYSTVECLPLLLFTWRSLQKEAVALKSIHTHSHIHTHSNTHPHTTHINTHIHTQTHTHNTHKHSHSHTHTYTLKHTHIIHTHT